MKKREKISKGLFRLETGEYQIDIRLNPRERYRPIFQKRKEAEGELEAIRTKKRENGGYLQKKENAKITFPEFAEIYMEEHAKVEKRSWKEDQSNLKHIKEFFRGKLLNQIDSSDVKRYKAARKGQDLAGATVNRGLALIRKIFNMALEYKRDGKRIFHGENPVKGIEFFEEEQRVRFLTRDELDRLYANLSGELKQMVVLAVNTGMRKSEIYNLLWEDINFEQGFMTVKSREGKETKSGKSRIIPLTIQAREVLDNMPRVDERVFRYERHRTAFENAVKDAKIDDFHFHDLRHTFASHFMMQGGKQYDLMAILGHSNLEMTQRYSHLSEEYKNQVMRKMDNFWTPKEAIEVPVAQ